MNKRGREEARDGAGEGGRRRAGKPAMLSEDINVMMNYSVMTTRSVIKNSAYICTVF